MSPKGNWRDSTHTHARTHTHTHTHTHTPMPQIVIPEFTKHCKLCDSCCRGFDHHCMWLTRCVGYNSHRYFVVFMMCLILDSFLFIYHALASELPTTIDYNHCVLGACLTSRSMITVINSTVLSLTSYHSFDSSLNWNLPPPPHTTHSDGEGWWRR